MEKLKKFLFVGLVTAISSTGFAQLSHPPDYTLDREDHQDKVRNGGRPDVSTDQHAQELHCYGDEAHDSNEDPWEIWMDRVRLNQFFGIN